MFPLPVVLRVERLHGLVRSLGWDGARALFDGEFAGWQADFIPPALELLADAERAVEMDYLANAVGVAVMRAF